MRNLNELPDNLPIPKDDGACDHLKGMLIPSVTLPSTANRSVNLTEVSKRKAVFFFYPRTGEPNKPAPENWDLIPGARGCTPQSCSFRDRFSDFNKIGIKIFGISTQITEYQQEFVKRNHIPYEILSDSQFLLTEALRLPTFEYNSMRLIKRLALFVEHGRIEAVFYPVFPPDKNAEQVLTWLGKNRRTGRD